LVIVLKGSSPKRLGLTLSFLISFAIGLLGQSPWPRSKAGAYAHLSWQIMPEYDAVFGEDGRRSTLLRKQREQSVQLYGEYGLTRSLTLMASLPLKFVEVGALTTDFRPLVSPGKAWCLGNASISLKKGLLNKKVRVSTALRVDFPSKGFEQRSGIRNGYDAFALLPTLSFGRCRERFYWYAYGGAGIRSRHYSRFANVGLEMGWHLNNFWLTCFSDGLYSFKDGTVELPLENQATFLFVDRQAWLVVGVKTTWEINRFFGVNLVFANPILARNFPKSPSLSLSAYFRWD
jgi:hypothetical protein